MTKTSAYSPFSRHVDQEHRPHRRLCIYYCTSKYSDSRVSELYWFSDREPLGVIQRTQENEPRCFLLKIDVKRVH